MNEHKQIQIIMAIFAGLFLLVSFELVLQFLQGSEYREKLASFVLLGLICANYGMFAYVRKRDQRKPR